MSPPAPLQSAAPNALLKSKLKTSEWNGKKSESTFHLFVNETDSEAELFWFYDGGQERHGSIAPHSNLYIGTYTFHQWKVVGPNGQLLGVYSGASATITIKANGCQIQVNGLAAGQLTEMDPSSDVLHTPEGPYRKRGEVLGMPIWAFDCVSEAAVTRLVHLTSRMLECSPDWVLQRLGEAGASLAIVGKEQVVTDLPPHRFMKHMEGRDLDKSSRGLGGTLTVPVTSVGEENLTMVEDRTYPCQSIFVHELGHAVLNLALDQQQQRRLCAAFDAARGSGTYPEGIYMTSNEQEYFATGTEAWFDSTIRTDVNGGINTREGVQAKDPALAEILKTAFGEGSWRYTQDCPLPLRMPGHADKRPALTQPGAEAMERPTGTNIVTATASTHGSSSSSSGAGPSGAAAATPAAAAPEAGPAPASGAETSASASTPLLAPAEGASGRPSSCWDTVGLPLTCCGPGGRPAKIPRLGWRSAWGLPGCSCLACSTLDGLTGCLPCVGWGLLREFKSSSRME